MTPVLRRINIPMVYVPIVFFSLVLVVKIKATPKNRSGLISFCYLGCVAPLIYLRKISDVHINANKTVNVVSLN